MDISTDGLHLAIYRGFLTVSANGEERGRIALDDIGALIVHAHGTTWSNQVFVRMAERNVPVVLCAANHAPVSVVWPLEGHHAQGARLRAQIDASKPLRKQLWQRVIAAKIRMQGQVLAANGKEAGAFDMLARKVRSGDPDNIEAQAARRYWKSLFGTDFYRDPNADGANALLNYGYTVLRALVSRAICASGLHPTIGIFHSNRANAFALADDLMEPYRPLVDQLVFNLSRNTVQPGTLMPVSLADQRKRSSRNSPARNMSSSTSLADQRKRPARNDTLTGTLLFANLTDQRENSSRAV